MATQLDQINEWLTQPAGSVAAEIVRQRQQAVRKAEKRLLASRSQDAAPDPEALHDFRVEVRRLRVWLKATAELVNTRKAERKRLRVLAKATNPARDFEVTQALLRRAAQEPELAETAEWLLTLSESQAPPAAEWSRDTLEPPRLKPRKGKQPKPLFGPWLAAQLTELLDTFDQELAAGDAALHSARIQGKHLRYLMEPFMAFDSVRDAVTELKRFQTQLGDIHDLVVFRQHLPRFAQWQLDVLLPPVLAHSGKQARSLQRSFGQVRDHITRLAGWQSAQYRAQTDQLAHDHPQRMAALREQVTTFVTLLGGDRPAAD